MADVTKESVVVKIDRILLDGQHVCTVDLRKHEGCPALSMLCCNIIGTERLASGAEIPGFSPFAILPHRHCPISKEAIGS